MDFYCHKFPLPPLPRKTNTWFFQCFPPFQPAKLNRNSFKFFPGFHWAAFDFIVKLPWADRWDRGHRKMLVKEWVLNDSLGPCFAIGSSWISFGRSERHSWMLGIFPKPTRLQATLIQVEGRNEFAAISSRFATTSAQSTRMHRRLLTNSVGLREIVGDSCICVWSLDMSATFMAFYNTCIYIEMWDVYTYNILCTYSLRTWKCIRTTFQPPSPRRTHLRALKTASPLTSPMTIPVKLARILSCKIFTLGALPLDRFYPWSYRV